MARRPGKPDQRDYRPVSTAVTRVAKTKERNAAATRHLALHDFLREHCREHSRSKGQRHTEFQRGNDPRRHTGGKP